MKRKFLTLFFTMAILPLCLAYGQSRNERAAFPTYKDIRPARYEINDYVPKNGTKTLIEHKMTFNLFDYPAGTVTYFLNDTITTDAAHAKKVVSRKGNQITNIAIEAPTSDGKRIIRFTILPDK